MKISDYITMMLFIGIVFFVMALMVNEGKDRYDTNINTTSWEEQYDYVTDINKSVSPIRDSLDELKNQETGWLSKIGAGFTGIIAAVTLIPSLMWNGLIMGNSLILGIFTSIKVPSYIIGVFIVMLAVWGIVKLLEFFQRWPV